MSSSWLEILTPIVRQAGTVIRQRLESGKPTATTKKAHDEWVTEMDRLSEDTIIERLRYYFPDYGVLGEESGLAGDAENCWVIDPLDGTTNFVHGFHQCAISVAFCRQGRPEVGVIYDIANDDLFTTALGYGAYLNNERIRVSKTTSFHQSLFIASGTMSYGNRDLWLLINDLAKRTDGMRRTGSTALDLAWLAAGRADAIVCGPVKFWDVAAGSLILREAGGLLSDITDKTEFAFNEKTTCFVAASPRVFVRFFTETKLFFDDTTSKDTTK